MVADTITRNAHSVVHGLWIHTSLTNYAITVLYNFNGLLTLFHTVKVRSRHPKEVTTKLYIMVCMKVDPDKP